MEIRYYREGCYKINFIAAHFCKLAFIIMPVIKTLQNFLKIHSFFYPCEFHEIHLY